MHNIYVFYCMMNHVSRTLRLPKKWSALIILTLLLGVGVGYLYVSQPGEETVGMKFLSEGQNALPISIGSPDAATRRITLFVGDPDQETLVKKTIAIQEQQELIPQITQTIHYLFQPAPNVHNPVIPEGTELINVFVSGAGNVYLNFSRHIQDRHIGGLSAELATVASLVNTVLFNFQEINQVQILVEGAEIETLVGHIDCRKPFSRMLSVGS